MHKHENKKPGGSSSYFDFVEEKAKGESAVNPNGAMDLAEGGRDAFIVHVVDEATAQKLKEKYFS